MIVGPRQHKCCLISSSHWWGQMLNSRSKKPRYFTLAPCVSSSLVCMSAIVAVMSFNLVFTISLPFFSVWNWGFPTKSQSQVIVQANVYNSANNFRHFFKSLSICFYTVGSEIRDKFNVQGRNWAQTTVLRILALAALPQLNNLKSSSSRGNCVPKIWHFYFWQIFYVFS